MAVFQIRRGGSSSKGNLSYGEPYLNADSQSVVFGASGSEEITLVKLNTGKTSNSKWSGSLANSGSLSITGDFTASNAYFRGDVYISGSITLGDGTVEDHITVVADFASSLIPSSSNNYDLGSNSKKWRRIYVDTASFDEISGIGNVTNFSSSITNRINNLDIVSASVNSYTASNTSNINAIHSTTQSLNSYTASNNTTNTTQNSRLSSLEVESGSIRSTFNSYTSSNNTDISALEVQSASFHSYSSSLNSFSASVIATGSIMNIFTSSVNTSTASLNSFSASVIATGSVINTFTSSVNNYTSSLNSAIELTGSNVTIKGNFLVKGTSTIVNSTTVDIGDNIISLNGTGASNAGLIVRDATASSLISGSLLWDTTNDYWKAGAVGSEEQIILLNQYNTFSSSINSRGESLESATSSLYSYTSSINNYTASNDAKILSIENTTSSFDGRLDLIETSTGSLNAYTASNDSLNSTQNSRLNSLETESGSVRSAFNSYTSSNNSRVDSLETESGSIRNAFNSFTSSYATHSSSFDSRIDALEGFSSSLDNTFVSEVEFGAYSGSINSYTSSANAKFISIESTTSSFDSRLDLLETSTASLNTYTASANSKFISIESTTSSFDGRLDSLENATSSLFISSSQLTSSLSLISQSFNTRINNIVAGTGFLEATTFEAYTSSADLRLGALESFTSSLDATFATDADVTSLRGTLNNYTSSNDGKVNSIHTATSSLNSYTASNDVINTAQNNRLTAIESFTSSIDTTYATDADVTSLRGTLNNYTSSNDGINSTQNGRLNGLESTSGSLNSFTASAISRFNSLESFTASIDSTYATDSDVTSLRGTLNTYTSSNDSNITSIHSFTSSINTTIKNKLNNEGVFSGSAQITTLPSVDTDDLGEGVTNLYYTDVRVKTKLNSEGVISGSSQVNLSLANGNITLGSQTSGNYVASLIAGTGVTITNNSGETATPTIAIGQAVETTSEVQFAKVGVGGASDATYELKITGDVGATGDIVAYISSDERLKDNIQLISNPIEKVKGLNGVTWEWNELASDAAKQSPNVGVVAQDVEKVLPQLVIDRENGFKGVDYAKLTGLLIEAIKTQQTTIENLEARINKLEGGE